MSITTQAKIQAINSQTVTLSVMTQTDCNGCQMCRLAPSRPFTLPNHDQDLDIGDHVTLTLSSNYLLSSALIFYTIPLLVMILGASCGQWLFHQESITIIFGFISLIISLIGLHYLPQRPLISLQR